MNRLSIYHSPIRLQFTGTSDKQRRYPCVMATVGRCNRQIKEGRKCILVSALFQSDTKHVEDFHVCRECWTSKKQLILETMMYFAVAKIKKNPNIYGPIRTPSISVDQIYKGLAPTAQQRREAENLKKLHQQRQTDIESFNKQMDETDTNS